MTTTANVSQHVIHSLMKYCEVVRDIAAKQGNWRYYDEKFFASLNLTDTNGITWLENYGTRPSVAPSSAHAKIWTMIFERGSPTSVPFSPFPKGCVGDFIPVSSAGAAISNTPASNVGQSIPQANAALTERTTVTQAMQLLTVSDSQGRTSVVEPRAKASEARTSRLLF